MMFSFVDICRLGPKRAILMPLSGKEWGLPQASLFTAKGTDERASQSAEIRL
jgi:hypothetical protein